MEPFKVNIATFNYYQNRINRWIVGCLVFLVVLATAMNVMFFYKNYQRIYGYESKIENLKSVIFEKNKRIEEKHPKINEGEKNLLKKNIAFVNKILLRDVFPWPNVLDVIEKNIPGDLTLDSVVYSGKLNEVIIKGRSTSTGGVSEFLDGLNTEKAFRKNILSILSIGPENYGVDSEPVVVTFEIVSELNFNKFLPGTYFENK